MQNKKNIFVHVNGQTQTHTTINCLVSVCVKMSVTSYIFTHLHLHMLALLCVCICVTNRGLLTLKWWMMHHPQALESIMRGSRWPFPCCQILKRFTVETVLGNNCGGERKLLPCTYSKQKLSPNDCTFNTQHNFTTKLYRFEFIKL